MLMKSFGTSSMSWNHDIKPTSSVSRLLNLPATLISRIDEIILTHDDVFGPGAFSLQIKSRAGDKFDFIGTRSVLQVADYLREDLMEASRRIQTLVATSGLFNNATVVFRR
jgi:hypothetical protein